MQGTEEYGAQGSNAYKVFSNPIYFKEETERYYKNPHQDKERHKRDNKKGPNGKAYNQGE